MKARSQFSLGSAAVAPFFLFLFLFSCERPVTWEELRFRWPELSEDVGRRWGRLTARDLRVIAGQRERLVGVLQQRYGRHRRTIERDVREFTH
jgi:uncharacterized protein YjbJ (UPF0337 family)